MTRPKAVRELAQIIMEGTISVGGAMRHRLNLATVKTDDLASAIEAAVREVLESKRRECED